MASAYPRRSHHCPWPTGPTPFGRKGALAPGGTESAAWPPGLAPRPTLAANPPDPRRLPRAWSPFQRCWRLEHPQPVVIGCRNLSWQPGRGAAHRPFSGSQGLLGSWLYHLWGLLFARSAPCVGSGWLGRFGQKLGQQPAARQQTTQRQGRSAVGSGLTLQPNPCGEKAHPDSRLGTRHDALWPCDSGLILSSFGCQLLLGWVGAGPSGAASAERRLARPAPTRPEPRIHLAGGRRHLEINTTRL